MKSITTVVAGLLLASAGVANAAQPLALSDAQMDNVSAGATAISNAGAVAYGVVVSLTGASTSTATLGNFSATAQATSGAIAVTALPAVFGPAIASSAASSTATLP